MTRLRIENATIVDLHDNGLAAVDVDDAHHGPEGKGAMACGHLVLIEDLAACGAVSVEDGAVPRGDTKVCHGAQGMPLLPAARDYVCWYSICRTDTRLGGYIDCRTCYRRYRYERSCRKSKQARHPHERRDQVHLQVLNQMFSLPVMFRPSISLLIFAQDGTPGRLGNRASAASPERGKSSKICAYSSYIFDCPLFKGS